MVIMRVIGIISFCLVGSLWIISSLLHRPIIRTGAIDGKGLDDKNELSDEEKAAVTVATWTVLHPPS